MPGVEAEFAMVIHDDDDAEEDSDKNKSTISNNNNKQTKNLTPSISSSPKQQENTKSSHTLLSQQIDVILEEWIFRDELFRQLTLDRVCPNPDSNLRLLDLVIADLLSKIDPESTFIGK